MPVSSSQFITSLSLIVAAAVPVVVLESQCDSPLDLIVRVSSSTRASV